MNLRRATVDDASALALLYDLVWAQEVSSLGEKLADERRADEKTIQDMVKQDTYFVIDVEGELVAAIGCEERHGTIHLVHTVTHPNHRRQGYASALMEKAEEFARETGANKIWFDTAPGLEAAQKLYEKLGYARCGYLKKQYWGTDLILYEKLL